LSHPPGENRAIVNEAAIDRSEVAIRIRFNRFYETSFSPTIDTAECGLWEIKKSVIFHTTTHAFDDAFEIVARFAEREIAESLSEQ
jgi:hypothetical protein